MSFHIDPDIGIKRKCSYCGHLISQHKQGCLYVGCKCDKFQVDLHKIPDKELEQWR